MEGQMILFSNGHSRNFEDLVMDDSDCPRSEVRAAIKESASFDRLHEELSSVARHLGIAEHRIRQLSEEAKTKFRYKNLPDLLDELLSLWKAEKGNQAKILHLYKAFQNSDLTDIAESLSAKFCTPIQPVGSNVVEVPRTFENMVMDDAGCTISRVVAIMEQSIKYRQLRTEWKPVARCLGIKDHKIDQLSLDYLSGRKVKTLEQLLSRLLVVWKETCDAAKISNLCAALECNGLKDVAQALSSILGRKEVVQEPEVKFIWQRKEMVLEKLLGQNISDETIQVIRDELGKNYYNQPIPRITEQIPTQPNFYIDRNLCYMPSTEVEPGIFSTFSATDHVFVFKDILQTDLDKLTEGKASDTSGNQLYHPTVKLILLERDDHFDIICEHTEKAVHLIRFEDGSSLWEKSSKHSELIQQHLKHNLFFSEKELVLRITSPGAPSAFSISGFPGNGKTLALGNLANLIQEKNPEKNVCIFIAIQEFFQKEYSIESKLSAIEAIAAYSSCSRVTELVLFEILKEKIFTPETDQSNSSDSTLTLYLFLDGYDEVTQDKLNKVDNFLKLLQGFENVKVIVTTRPHQQRRLEIVFNHCSYEIVPFDESNQIHFLTNYWEDQYGANNHQLKEFAIDIISDLEKEIAGIPLQCMMLAEVHAEDAKKLNSLSRPISLFQMYRRLFNLKFSEISEHSVQCKYIIAHVFEAVKMLFPECVDLFKSLSEIRKEVSESSLYSIGLIEKSPKAHSPRFIHRTFAEYMLAEFIVKNINRRLEFRDLLFVEILGSKGTFKNPGKTSFNLCHPVLVHFIEIHLNEYIKLHTIEELLTPASECANYIHSCLPRMTLPDICLATAASYEKDLETIFTFSWELLNRIEMPDEIMAKRTPLMNVIKFCGSVDDKLLDVFYKAKANFNAKDKEGNSVLFYAIAYADADPFSFIKQLLQYEVDVNHRNKELENVAHKIIERKLVAKHSLGLLNLLESRYGFNQFNGKDSRGRTCLNYAYDIESNDSDLIKFLLARVSSST